MRGADAPPRDELLRSLRDALRKLAPPLEVIAERILGLESRIDLVARDARGRAVIVAVAEDGTDLLRLGDLLAQRSWLEPRLADWIQLAPRLGLDPGQGVGALLLATHFDPRTIAAARSLPEEMLCLSRCGWTRRGDELEVWLERVGVAAASVAALAVLAPEACFRTGLTEDDLGTARPEPGLSDASAPEGVACDSPGGDVPRPR